MKQISLFKEVMSNYPTGVSVITTYDTEQQPVGLTVNSFSSVSLNPLLILWSIDKNSTSYETFLQTGNFSVNILAADQTELCKLFATQHVNRFAQCEWRHSTGNLPVLSDPAAILQCEVYEKIEAGDHTIIIGQVFDIINNDVEPLLYHKRGFKNIATLENV